MILLLGVGEISPPVSCNSTEALADCKISPDALVDETFIGSSNVNDRTFVLRSMLYCINVGLVASTLTSVAFTASPLMIGLLSFGIKDMSSMRELVTMM